ncbi:MAG TPA: NYN domain-containing protein [Ferruginibacter sp.]|nr:NYN domain-containing protein [Ferruginibacter sp.]HRE64727.1 NYN domain-containing protein [Ferruginibacter sp.]
MNTSTDLKLAVLIDADNVPYSGIKAMMEEIARYGSPTFKRIYGDWTKPTLSGWKTVLLENAINPVQQYSYTSGKNATDSALIIDAMDILYTGQVDGFCIVSSDSDFTRLAMRLRESGKIVIGIGEQKTPGAFISACNKFIYIEILAKENKEDAAPSKKSNNKKQVKQNTGTSLPAVVKNLITRSVNDLTEEDGWVFLSTLGNHINRKQPSFDPRNYGFKKLVDIIRHIPALEVEERHSGKNNIAQLYVRVK